MTPLLCATAFARPDRLSKAAKWSREQALHAAEKVGDRMRGRYRLFAVLRPKPEPEFSVGDERTRDPGVVIGDAYARWVLRRVAGADRPVPVIGFDQAEVVDACRHGAALGRQRRLLITCVPVLCSIAPAVGALTLPWTGAVLLVLLWAVFFSDRVRAQYAAHTLLKDFGSRTPAVLGPPPDNGVSALPYALEKKDNGYRRESRFVGAGLEVWRPSTIAVDVTKGLRGPSPHDPRSEYTESALTALLDRFSGGTTLEPKDFTLTELYEHVARDLARTVASPDNPADHRGVDVIGIWGTSHAAWGDIDDTAWDDMPPVTEGLAPGDTAPDSRLARPYLWARVTSWSGSLTVSVLVRFVRREEYVRVVVIPQVVAPVVDEVSAPDAGSPSRLPWLVTAAAQAIGDVVALGGGLVVRRPPSAPEIDSGSGPVSLREAYSKRRVEDMHMKDDTDFQAATLQRRVFASVDRFLQEHDIDVEDYRQATTNAIVNFGVIGDKFTGPVQNNAMGDNNTQHNQQGEAA
ncbi:hypothetical protein [Nocardiopsis ansamitocini]|uniref:Uncharacterized protein n=1 Tax=Nocardiopsis ansamitocini TaxID=1670832 RepID=A0A9W6UG43_9ACTN|nr:hypothetical protein [Nocardiopsis ansamitocini]GLU46531.1 hypothetical protein Nans01_08820 [Nocardiopsis ansamitocini]